METDTKQAIEDDIKNNRVMLYMKGSPAFPQCGFSNQVVQILRMHGAEFGSRDVLADMSIREGIKEFSDWPTVPQLYVNGEFIGGCDIITEMHNAGELEAVLKDAARQDAT